MARRLLVREPDGVLTDVVQHRSVDVSELLDDLRSGLPFRVRRRSTGKDCTIEVLAEVLAESTRARCRCGRNGDRLSVLSDFADALHPTRQPTECSIHPR